MNISLLLQSQICSSKVCEGSIMTPKAMMRSPSTVPGSDDILMQAIDFINQYYKSIKK